MIRLFLFFLLLPFSAYAELSLMEWKPEGFSLAFLLPAKEGESPEEARERYLQSLEADPELKEFAQELRAAQSGKLGKFESTRDPLVLVLANTNHDLIPAQERIHRVSNPLKKRGAKVLVAPIAFTAGLTAKEASEARGLLNREVDLLMAVGGADIHPSLYGDLDPAGLSDNTILARDKEELQVVRSFLDDGKGFFSGICRGHQMGGVASDCKLIKDIETELKLEHPRHSFHEITPRQPKELTRRLFGENKSLEVTSNHHQAVLIPNRSNKKIRVTAISAKDKKIAEVSEYAGGRGLSVQGHPEDVKIREFHERFYDLVFGETKAANQRRVNAMSRLNFPAGARGNSCSDWFRLVDPSVIH